MTRLFLGPDNIHVAADTNLACIGKYTTVIVTPSFVEYKLLLLLQSLPQLLLLLL